MKNGSVYQRLLHFLDIDDETKARARRLGELLEPHFDSIIERFYAKVMAANVNPHINARTVKRLKTSQRNHWLALFRTSFDDDYVESVRRIGAKHRYIELDPLWYISGYALLKIEFTHAIIRADLSVVEKGQLIKTLDKYVAIDMGLSLSSYEPAYLD